jgi:DNA-directed RNA polymerase specialized sigma24 family protein
MSSREFVAARLREAWDTLRRVPAQTVPALRSSWPLAIQNVADAYGYTPPAVRLAPASPQAIDRMLETFAWFAALDGHPHLTRAVWLTAAAGMGPRRAGHILGIHRDTVRARRDEALDRMAEYLRRARPIIDRS